MDCFSISISCGIVHRRMERQVLVMAFFFGLFQAVMPLLGWLMAGCFYEQVEAYDHWVAFGLLSLLGGKMIWNYLSEGSDATPSVNPSRLSSILLLALATSVDALAVGFTFMRIKYTDFAATLWPAIVIGAGSFLLTVLGKYIGVQIGRRVRIPAELFGGLILIGIGIKVLYTHLSE